MKDTGVNTMSTSAADEFQQRKSGAASVTESELERLTVSTSTSQVSRARQRHGGLGLGLHGLGDACSTHRTCCLQTETHDHGSQVESPSGRNLFVDCGQDVLKVYQAQHPCPIFDGFSHILSASLLRLSCITLGEDPERYTS